MRRLVTTSDEKCGLEGTDMKTLKNSPLIFLLASASSESGRSISIKSGSIAVFLGKLLPSFAELLAKC